MHGASIRNHVNSVSRLLNDMLAAANEQPQQPISQHRTQPQHRCVEEPGQKFAPLIEQALAECDRALAALTHQPRELADSKAVEAQLLEAVSISAVHAVESHPFGSTVAHEALLDVELESDVVEIAVETDNLPCWIEASWTDDGMEVDLEFRLTRVDWHTPSSMQSTAVEYAVYAVEIV